MTRINQSILQKAVKTRTDLPQINAGMKVQVSYKIREDDKERIQVLKGIIIKTRVMKEPGATFTLRKVGAGNVGIEWVIPYHSPNIQKIQIVEVPKTRRAKLYFLRDISKKKIRAKLKTKFKEVIVEPEKTVVPAETPKE